MAFIWFKRCLRSGLALLLLLLPSVSLADEDDDLEGEFDLFEEEEQVFSASKYAQPISDSPSTITVITREQIENSHCLDLTCLLGQVPEIEVRRVWPMYHAVGARSNTDELSDKGLVLVDGWEINLESFGIPFWGLLPVHMEDVERIEIMRGPGSSLYGANAHSMVVSITTRKPERDGGEGFVSAGEHGNASLNLRLGKLLGDWTLELTGGLESADHYALAGQDQKDGGRVRFRAIRAGEGDSRTVIQAGMSTAEGFISTRLAPIYLDNTYFSNLMIAHQQDWIRAHLWATLFDSDVHFDLPLIHRGVVLGTFPESLPIMSSTLDGDVQANFSFWEGGQWLVGLNYRWLTYISKANVDEVVHQHRAGAYLQFEQRFLEQLLLNLAARVDYNSITPTSVSPRAALGWRLSEHQVLRLAAGRSFRKPSFFNTHFRIATVEGSAVTPNLDEFFARSVGNPKLGNETLNAAELGYRGRFLGGDLVVEADGYVHLLEDPVGFDIDLVTGPLGINLTETSAMFANRPSDVATVGGSVSLVYKPIPSLRLSANYSYRYSWYLGENPYRENGAIGKRFPWEPDHLVNLAASWSAEMGLRVGLALNYRSSYKIVAQENGALFGDVIFQPVDASVAISGHLAYRFDLEPRWLEVGLRVWNLGNAPVRETSELIRFDGTEMGGHLLVRQVNLFLRGAF